MYNICKAYRWMFLEESIIAKITEAASVKICSWLISQNLKGEDVLSYSFFFEAEQEFRGYPIDPC